MDKMVKFLPTVLFFPFEQCYDNKNIIDFACCFALLQKQEKTNSLILAALL